MLASIFSSEVLSWNTTKTAKNEDSNDIVSENELSEANPRNSQTEIFNPKLNDDIFRDKFQKNDIIECF